MATLLYYDCLARQRSHLAFSLALEELSLLQIIELALALLPDIFLAVFHDEVLNDLLLGVEDYVSELAKILYNIACFEFSLNDQGIFALIEMEVRIFYEFFDDWVQDSVEVLVVLLQP